MYSLSSGSCADSAFYDIAIVQGSYGDTNFVTNCYTADWRGDTYTTSGIYTDTITNSIGCDSILILNLTINPRIIADTLDTTVCNSYTWQGQEFTTTGLYSDTLTSSLTGCDSVVYLNLTLLQSSDPSLHLLQVVSVREMLIQHQLLRVQLEVLSVHLVE